MTLFFLININSVAFGLNNTCTLNGQWFDFTNGAAIPIFLKQEGFKVSNAQEMIRRNNCGVEYRWEPRDAPNCAGQWILSNSCKVQKKKGADNDYNERIEYAKKN